VPTLHFVRHGETDWNREGRIQGVADVALSAAGREQARELAVSLAARPIGAIYASDLRRTVETAEPLAARLDLPILTTPALRERDFGANEGRIAAEVAAELGTEVGTRWLHPDERHPGGESMREVYERVAAFLDELLEDPPADEIALVTSGGPIRVGTAHLAREPIETIVWRAVENCSVTTVEVEWSDRESVSERLPSVRPVASDGHAGEACVS
jgi:2,3-bisphosphoglycerate-dependent phosphoglycerate mutase